MAVAVRAPRAAVVVPNTAAVAGSVLVVMAGLYLTTRTAFSGPQLLVVALFGAVTVWMATTKRTLWALGGLLVYMGLLDGFLKLKADNELPTIGRDVLLYAVLFGLVARAKLAGQRFTLPVFGGWALAWTLLVLVQLGNPGNGTWAHSLAALRQHLEFVPLLFLGYLVLRSEPRLKGFLALLLAVAAVNGAVGAYQSGLSPEQLASWGPGYSDLINGVGVAPRTAEGADGEKRVRPPGLGSDMGFAGFLGITAIPGGIALLMLSRRRRAHATLVSLGLLGAVVGALTSQSRTVVVSVLLSILAFVFLIAVGGQARRSLMAIALAGVTAVLAIWAIGSVDSNVFYRYRSVAPTQVLSTTVASREGTWDLIPQYASEIPFGAGIGSVGPASGFLDDRDTRYNAESIFTFLIVEVGIPGMLLFLAFQTSVFFAVLRGLRRVPEPSMALLLAAISAPLFVYVASWGVGTPTTSSPNAPYMWLSTGIIGYWLVARIRRPSGLHP